MSIYISLLLILVISYIIANFSSDSNDINKKNNSITKFLFVLIFFICALRASSVGRDLPGYERVYELTKNQEFGNFYFVYFENGYLLLSKLCILLGLNFQWFIAICYVIILLPIYIFIDRYSSDKIFSVIIFVCYMYFEFDLTALRQAISMSISLISFMVLLSEKKFRVFYFVLIVFVASLFHKGANICYILLPLLLIKDMVLFTMLLSIGSILSIFVRRYLFIYIKNFFNKETFSIDARLYIGANLIFLIIIGIIFLIIQTSQSKINNILKNNSNLSEVFYLKLYLTSISIAFIFGMETAARSYMYFNQSIFILLPNYIKSGTSANKKIYLLFVLSFIGFFVYFFFANSLGPNSFDIIPYKFFWQI